MKKTVLVVDDETSTRTLLRDVLQSEGIEVLEAEDGRTALKLIKERPVDLVITDRAMPGLGGLELLKELRRLNKEIPAIMISAYGEDSLWGEAIGLGALDYLVKPFAAEAVIQAVRKSLFGRAAS